MGTKAQKPSAATPSPSNSARNRPDMPLPAVAILAQPGNSGCYLPLKSASEPDPVCLLETMHPSQSGCQTRKTSKSAQDFFISKTALQLGCVSLLSTRLKPARRNLKNRLAGRG